MDTFWAYSIWFFFSSLEHNLKFYDISTCIFTEWEQEVTNNFTPWVRECQAETAETWVCLSEGQA